VDNFEDGSALPVIVPDAVCFETGASRSQAADPELCVYEHHGDGFGWADPGALTCFFDDLIHGRPMPPKFATRGIRDIDVLVALALQRSPGLAVCPNALKLVTAADLVHRRGAVGMAHVDPELTQFFRFLRGLFPSGLTKSDFERSLGQAVEYIQDFIGNDRLPQMGREPEPPTVLDTGSRGFVLAEAQGSLGEAWVQLFRRGFVRGVVLGKDQSGRRHVLGARKGPFVDFKLDAAARLLNEIERAMGELPEWKNDVLWLYSPPDGTNMLVSHMLQVFIRV
jgi:hypothetical protein